MNLERVHTVLNPELFPFSRTNLRSLNVETPEAADSALWTDHLLASLTSFLSHPHSFPQLSSHSSPSSLCWTSSLKTPHTKFQNSVLDVVDSFKFLKNFETKLRRCQQRRTLQRVYFPKDCTGSKWMVDLMKYLEFHKSVATVVEERTGKWA